MSKQRLHGSQREGGDSAVSPVIAVILMVAITVVLAATVYVWVSGFTDTGNQSPSANFRHVSCDEATDGVTVKLTSGGPLQKDDIKAFIYNKSQDDREEATVDPLASSGQWSTGSQLVIDDGTNSGPDWNGTWTTSTGMGDGFAYRLDYIHKPTSSTFASLPFTC